MYQNGISRKTKKYRIITMMDQVAIMSELWQFPQLGGDRHPDQPIIQDNPLVCHCRQPARKNKMLHCSSCTRQFHIHWDNQIKQNNICHMCKNWKYITFNL
jgi:hypothetical protein